MADTSEEAIWDWMERQKDFIFANVATLTMKQLSKSMEEDLGLPEKSLRGKSRTVENLLDKLLKDKLVEAPMSEPSGKSADGDSKHTEQEGKRRKHTKPKSKPPKTQAASPNAAKSKPTSPKSKLTKGSGKVSTGEEGGRKRAEREGEKALNYKLKAEKLERVLRSTNIRIGPATLKKRSDPRAFFDALQALAKPHDLGPSSTRSDIAAAKKSIERAKELEGINEQNIIHGGRRSRGAVNYAQIERPDPIESDPESELEEEEEDSDEDDDVAGSGGSSPQADESDAENTRPRNGAVKRQRMISSDEEAEDEDANTVKEASPGRSRERKAGSNKKEKSQSNKSGSRSEARPLTSQQAAGSPQKSQSVRSKSAAAGSPQKSQSVKSKSAAAASEPNSPASSGQKSKKRKGEGRRVVLSTDEDEE